MTLLAKKISNLLFADDLVLLAENPLGLQRASDGFDDECRNASMRISKAETEVMVISRKLLQCPIQVGVETLKQVEKFKYLGFTLTSDGRLDREINNNNRKAKAGVVLSELNRRVVGRAQLIRQVKLEVFKSLYY